MISKRTRNREKQRIVKITMYPEEPKKNTVELSNTTKTFAEVQKAETELAKQEAISISNSTQKKVLENYSTTEEMETKITASKEEVELGVMHTLQDYYAKTETDALIEVTKGEIELGVSQTYQTKAAMGDYSTTEEVKSLIDITAEEISSEVSKKVDETEIGTLISQNAYYVRVAWNGNSKYIQFEDGGISMYDGSVEESKKRAVFNYSGEHFYRDGYYVGKIGTNQWSSDNSHKGLVFDLEYQGKYMAFAQKKTADATSYTTMLCFSRENSIYDTYGIHLGCDIDMHGYSILNPKFEGGGITATINYVQVLKMNSDGTVAQWGSEGKMVFTNGILTDLKYYTPS